MDTLLGRRGLGWALGLHVLWLAGTASAQPLLASASPASRATWSGQHCLGEARQKLLLEHRLAGSINPLRIGSNLRLGLCTPLVNRPGLLFNQTQIDVGVLLANSPSNINFGAFVSLSPLSFLTLRAEASVFYVWPTPLEGSGFITLKDSTYFRKPTLSPSPFGENAAGSASGGRILLGATLRGETKLGKWLSIAVADAFNAEYLRISDSVWSMTEDPASRSFGNTVFYSARRDVVLSGPGDWALINTATLLLGINVHPNVVIRLGPTDELIYVPSQPRAPTYGCVVSQPDFGTAQFQTELGYLGNVAGALVALVVKKVNGLASNISILARFGAFTHHAFRECSGTTIAIELGATYELFSRSPNRRATPAAPPAPSSISVPSQ